MEFLSEPTLIVAIGQLIVGLVLISFAADAFVEGAANVAKISKISPIIIGACIVGFGTSAPELLVSAVAAFNGEVDLGVGNIVGSNVANLSLVLGAAALVSTITVSKAVLSREAALSLGGTLLFALFTLTGGGYSVWEGIVLAIVLAGALFYIVRSGVAEGAAVKLDEDTENVADFGSVGGQLVRTIVGLVGVVVSAQLLVWGATAIAEEVGLSGGFVGISLVAVGTSLPELVTAVVAARKGATELIIGNLLGSNMFNSLAVGGAIAIVGSGQIEDKGVAQLGIAIMTGVSVGTYIYMRAKGEVARGIGIALLVIWAAAIAVLGVSA